MKPSNGRDVCNGTWLGSCSSGRTALAANRAPQKLCILPVGNRVELAILARDAVAKGGKHHVAFIAELGDCGGNLGASAPALEEALELVGDIAHLALEHPRHHRHFAVLGCDQGRVKHPVLDREMGPQDSRDLGQAQGQRISVGTFGGGVKAVDALEHFIEQPFGMVVLSAHR